MKIFILTEGGKDIGFGHITRCISLSQAFEEKGVKSKFIINGDDSIMDLLKGQNYRIFNWIEERDRLFKIIADAEIAIVDSYLADTSLYNDLSTSIRTPVYIDDNMRIDYPRGIVVNGSIYAEEMNYAEREGVTHLLGIKYFPLRKEFWEVPEKEIKKNIESVIVTFGGDDKRGMTTKVLKLLVENHPSLIKKVIIGKGFKDIKAIEKAKDKKTELIYYPNAASMKDVMLESDLAISVGGQTSYELARIGIPTIATAVADNQLNNIKGWQMAGFIEYAGWWEDSAILKNIENCINEFMNIEKRLQSYRAARSLIDGNGSKLIAEFMVSKSA